MNVAEACAKEPRLRACVIMDAAITVDAVKGGLRQSVMEMTRDAGTMRLERAHAGGWSEKDIRLTQDTMRAIYDAAPGVFHLNFIDAPYWSPQFPVIGLTGSVNAQRTFDAINAYSVAFFEKEL